MKKFILTILFGALIGATLQHRVSGPGDAAPEAPDTVYVEAEPDGLHVSAKEVQWMARAIYSETKSQEDAEYVGWVIRNRMKSPDYPSTARSVVLEPYQFSAFNSTRRRRELQSMSFPETKVTSFRQAYRTAEYVLSAPDSINPLPEATHFYMHNTLEREYGKTQPHWASSAQLAWATQETRYYRMN